MPRSPSRDLSDRFIGEPRRYFRRWNDVEKWKLWFSAVAAVLVTGWAVASFGWKRETESQLTHGPLADAHAAWDNQCEACHKPPSGSTLDAFAKWNSFTCEKCHAAPTHHASIPADDAANANCASCHHDHQGRTNSLVRMTDTHCVRCHQSLLTSTYAPAISHFTADHPEFKPLVKPRPSTIKFSHGQHLTPGMAEIQGSKAAMTLAKLESLSPGQSARYRKDGQAATDLVQLDCRSCHTTNVDGRTFAPINFDASCKACHPTSTPNVVKQGNQVVAPFAVPHGKQLDELTKLIEGTYSLSFQTQHIPLFQSPNPFDPKRKDEPAVKAFAKDVADATASAKRFLQTACVKCHQTEGDVVKPAAIPAIWMTHAKFDHAAHRASDCASCHPKAVGRFVSGESGYEREPVNILGVESCRTCHAPKKGEAGGIRHGCSDCHTFHGGDHPLRGRGNPANAPQPPLTWKEFLRGK